MIIIATVTLTKKKTSHFTLSPLLLSGFKWIITIVS